MDEIKMWMESKKKTYWKTWPTKKGYAWVLFFNDDEVAYYHGEEKSEERCIDEIKWAIGSFLKTSKR